MFDVWTMLLFGLIGFAMKARDWPVAPMILGFILGPMFENYLRQVFQTAGGSFMFLLRSPIALVFLGLAVVMLLLSRKFYSTTKQEFSEEI